MNSFHIEHTSLYSEYLFEVHANSILYSSITQQHNKTAHESLAARLPFNAVTEQNLAENFTKIRSQFPSNS